MTRILILGANGMLGHKLCRLLPSFGHDVIGTVRGDMEAYCRYEPIFGQVRLIGDIDALHSSTLRRLIDEIRPDWTINCIGLIKQRPEASSQSLNVAVNTCLPHGLARMTGEIGGRLVHISTDCVFSGKRGNYTEDDPSDARDLYGKSKFLGETDASESSAITLRTSMIGRELGGHAHGLLEWFLSNRGGSVRGFSGAIYTGFTTAEICKIVQRLIKSNSRLNGTWHVASAPISKFELLNLVNREYGLGVQIEEDTEFFCDRSLLMDRFEKKTGYTAPSWEEMIKAMYSDDIATGVYGT